MQVIQLSDFRKPIEPMSKRTFDASLKSITNRIASSEISAQQGYESIQRLIHDYFFPEGR